MPTTLLMLINRSNRPPSRITQWPTRQNRKSWLLHIQSSSVRINEHQISLALINIKYLLLSWTRNIRDKMLGLLSSSVFFGSSMGDSRDLWVNDSLVDECFFWVEVFIEGGADHAVVVYADSVLLEKVI